MTLPSRHDSKFKTCRSETEYATFRSRRLPTIPSFTWGWRKNIFFSFTPPPETGKRTPNSGVKGSGANHYLCFCCRWRERQANGRQTYGRRGKVRHCVLHTRATLINPSTLPTKYMCHEGITHLKLIHIKSPS